MLFRFTPADGAAAQKVAEVVSRFPPGWETLINRRGVVLIWKPDAFDVPALILPFGCGALFGAVFSSRDGASKPFVYAPDHEAELWDWLATGGESLMRACWGAFIAVLYDGERDRVIVTRDAAGGRPIFLSERQTYSVLFSHVEDWLLCEPEAGLDMGYLSAFVAQSRIVTEATAFEGVREILPGQRWISTRSASTIDTIWRPSAPINRLSFKDGCAKVRESVFDCAEAWVRLKRPIVHRLSGGVDSAIVLAALCRSGEGIVCLNERPIGFPEGDEWKAAQSTAMAQGVSIIASPASPDQVKYERLLDAEVHAKPSLADLSYAEPSLLRSLQTTKASIVTSGQGGDQIFQRGRAPYMAADALVDGVGFKQLLRIALDVARQSRTHVWEVLGAALRYGALPRSFDAIGAQAFETPLATEKGRTSALEFRRTHPWMEDANQTSPARAMRITRLSDLAFYAQPTALARHYITAPVLAARPVLETILEIAPYTMIEGGIDRALERAAFADCIPARLQKTTRKGDATQYHTRVLELNRAFVRDLLLGGELKRMNLMNADAAERALAGAWMVDGLVKANVITCLLAEAWLARLNTARQRARAHIAKSGSETGAGLRPAAPPP